MGAIPESRQSNKTSSSDPSEGAGSGGFDEGDDRQSVRDSGGPTDLSEDEIFDVLRNSRRRAVIAYLLEEERASVKELTKQVGADEYDVDADELSPEQHKRVYTGLYQCHLPRLDDLGVVDFEKEDKVVSLRESASQLEPYLQRNGGSRVARFELVGAVAVASLVTLGILGVGPLDSVPMISWALLTVVALFGFALFQLYRVQRL